MVDWWQQLDLYCERTDTSFWSEPLNLISNACFFIAAFIAHKKRIHSSLSPFQNQFVKILTVISVCIGIGSALFHSLAYRWSQIADVAAIAIYVGIFLFIWTRFYMQWSYLKLGGMFLLVASISGASHVLLANQPLAGSQAYLGILFALFTLSFNKKYRKNKTTINHLLIAAIIFCFSLVFRTIDPLICSKLPYGSHFLWHILNAIVLYHTMMAAVTRDIPLSFRSLK